MRTNVAKWGHSLAVRIPSALARQIGLSEGSVIDLSAKGDSLVLQKPAFTLETLLKDITPENLHGETGTGPAVGKEEW